MTNELHRPGFRLAAAMASWVAVATLSSCSQNSSPGVIAQDASPGGGAIDAPVTPGPALDGAPADGQQANGDGGIGAPAVGSGMIGMQGGMVRSEDGVALLQVPAGALASNTSIRVEPVPVAMLPEGAIGPGYRFEPAGLIFTQPALLRLDVSAAMASGIKPAAIRIGNVLLGEWVPAGTPMIDEGAQTVSVTLPHFSVFGAYIWTCRPDQSGRCSWTAYEACTTGLGPTPVCAIPCVGDGDCPSPLYCIGGGCALKGCYTRPEVCTRPGHVCAHTYGYTNSDPEYHNELCLPGCNPAQSTECPAHPHMSCFAPSCTIFKGCASDNGCRRGELCYHGGLLQWAGSQGECLPCELGCDCKDPDCPCVEGAKQKRCLDDTSPFAGIWKGSYGGAGAGTWEGICETDGSVTGTHEGTRSSSITGTIDPEGSTNLRVKGAGDAYCAWKGTATPMNASGTWRCDESTSGSWSGAKVAELNPYRGLWTGTFTGGAVGTWNLLVDALGESTGQFTGTAGVLGRVDAPLSGTVNPDGTARVATADCVLSGTVAEDAVSGTWSCNGGLLQGTWSGLRP